MQAVQASAGSSPIILSDQDAVSQAIESANYLVLKRKMQQKVPLTMDDFSAICFRCPCIAHFAIQTYPELAKNAPFELLLALCRRSTFQDVIYEALDANVVGTPTTEDILIWLIKAGATITGKEKITGYTLLHHAIENDLARAANVLIDYGIDPLAKVNGGVTPLHMASRNGYKFYRVIEKILKNTEAVSQVTKCGSTALHYAARARDIEAVKLLIDAGADRLALDEMEQTALDIAKLVPENFHVVNRLQESDASHAFACSTMDKAIALLQQGEILPEDDYKSLCIRRPADALMVVEKCPQSLIHFSDRFFIEFMKGPGGHSENLARKLLAAGVSIRGKDEKSGCTALHFALAKRHSFLAKELLAAGLEHSACDEYKRTPLHYSAEHDMHAVVVDLVQAGASILVKNDFKQTPFQVALEARSRQWLIAYVNLLPAPFRDFAAKKSADLYGVTASSYSEVVSKFATYRNEVLACCTSESTPLEILLFFGIKATENGLSAHLTAKQKAHGIQLLCKKYPGYDSYINSLLACCP